MTAEQIAVVAAAGVAARMWWTRTRIARLTRRRDTADQALNRTLRRWF